MNFKETLPTHYNFPDYKTIRNGFLISAGYLDDFNTMTAGWASFGVFWSRPVITIYVKKSRYTFNFLNLNDYFTASFLPKEMASVIKICGTVHGNEVDKIAETHLTPFTLGESVGFEEAKTILLCKKLYEDDVRPKKIFDPTIDCKFHETIDCHRIYVGEIIKVLEKDE